MLAYPFGIEFYRSHILIITPFYVIYKNPCAKTVWLFLDSIRAGICFAFMLLSKNIPTEIKKHCDFKPILTIKSTKTLCAYLVWMLILPDFKNFVKALVFRLFIVSNPCKSERIMLLFLQICNKTFSM